MADEKTAQEVVYGGNSEEAETTPTETQEVEPTGKRGETIYGGEDVFADMDTPTKEVTEEPAEAPAGEETPVEEKAETELTPEEQSVKFWQHGYQVAIDRLKEVDPNFQDFYEEMKTERKKSGNQRNYEQSAKGANEVEQRYVSEMTADELVDMINKNVSEASKVAFRDVQARANYGNELRVAKQVVEGFTTQNNIPKEDLQQALEYAYKDLGLLDNEPGGPTKVARVVIDRLRLMGLQKHVSEKVNKTTAEVAAKVKAEAMVKQPNTATIPVRAGGTKTKEEIILEKMYNVDKRKASKDVYGV